MASPTTSSPTVNGVSTPASPTFSPPVRQMDDTELRTTGAASALLAGQEERDAAVRESSQWSCADSIKFVTIVLVIAALATLIILTATSNIEPSGGGKYL